MIGRGGQSDLLNLLALRQGEGRGPATGVLRYSDSKPSSLKLLITSRTRSGLVKVTLAIPATSMPCTTAAPSAPAATSPPTPTTAARSATADFPPRPRPPEPANPLWTPPPPIRHQQVSGQSAPSARPDGGPTGPTLADAALVPAAKEETCGYVRLRRIARTPPVRLIRQPSHPIRGPSPLGTAGPRRACLSRRLAGWQAARRRRQPPGDTRLEAGLREADA